jgi:hypothetical protein
MNDALTLGASGLSLAEREPPDAVILDLLMPEMDDFAFIERLRRSLSGQNLPGSSGRPRTYPPPSWHGSPLRRSPSPQNAQAESTRWSKSWSIL